MTNALAGPDQVPGWFDRMATFLKLFGECERQGKLKMLWRSDRYYLWAVTQADAPGH